jgi:multiple sugar transport system substrate-binding protein
MKKRIFSVVVCMIIMTMITGCSGFTNKSTSTNEQTKDGKIVLKITAPRDTTGTMDKIIEKYNSLQDKVQVKFVQTPADVDQTHDTFVTYLSGKDSSIDIYYLDVIWVPEFVEAGWITPIDELLTEEDKQDFLPAALQSFTYKGKLSAIPYFADGGMLYYRTDLLEKYGLTPPKDWNELVQQAKMIQEKEGIHGLAIQAAQYEGLVCNFLEYAWGNGGDILKGDKVVINSKENIEALSFMKGLIDKEKIVPKGTVSYKEDESLQLFTEGKAVFHRNWAYAWGVAQGDESKVAGKVGIVPMVAAPGKSGNEVSTFGPQGYAISAFSKHPEEAKDFLKYLTSTEAQKEMLLGAGYTPTRKSVYEDSEVAAKHPYLKQQLKSFELAKPRPVNVFYPEMSNALQIQLHKALLGELSPEEALQNAEKEINDILKRN